MNCLACGSLNEDGRKFCGECGAALGRTCAACGAANPPTVKFCGECGSPLQGSTLASVGAPTDQASGGTERRLVSVLFLDLVGFTALSEQRDAEDVRALLGAYFDTARTIIERHGGAVEKFIGDAVMAVWGAPVAHEDDAERAVRTALELVDGVQALGEAEGVPLKARGGVLTGEAATVRGAVAEGMVTGDMVNTASRLQSAADPGTVYVGEATFRAASRAIAFEAVGALTLKGKEAPVLAWRALRVVADRGGANRMAIEPPFVGRTEELRLLKELFHATGRDGKARIVSVTGIGGIGKSRLAREFEKYADGLTEPILWHQGRCPSYGDGVTFWALGEMVRMRAQIAEGDVPEEARAKLTRSLLTHVPDPEERAWIEPRLAFLLALGERPTGGGEELFAAWRAFFERLAVAGPVVMVFEDLQWADPGLVDFIGSLLEWSRSHRILVVTLARPEFADRRPDWGAGLPAFTSIHLGALPDVAIGELVHGLVPDAPSEVAAKIVERAGGVPLYAVETIRMLADRGILRVGDAAYELAQPLEELEIPETLQALIASRLDTLDPAERTLLQDAAVLGKSFTAAALSAVAGGDAATLETRLRDLVRREFLVVEADPRSPERGQFAFTQSLIREVAYGTLSKSDRRALHLTAANHFESADDEELAGVVAAHYVEALEATPAGPDADALAARARDWLRRASDRAVSLGSPTQALAFAEQALSFTQDGDERRALLLLAADAAEDALRPKERERLLQEAADLAGSTGDRIGEVQILLDLLRSIFFTSSEAVAELAGSIVARFGDAEEPAIRACTAWAASFVSFMEKDYEAALRSLDEAFAGFDRLDDTDRFLNAIRGRGVVLGLVGRRQEAGLLARGYVETVRRRGDHRHLAESLDTAGIMLTPDDPRGALDAYLEGIAIARKGGYGGVEVHGLANAVESAVELGEWEIADGMLSRLREVPSLPETSADALSLDEALLAAYRGDHDVAVAALSAVQRPDAVRFEGWVARVRSVVLTQGGDPDAGFDAAMTTINVEPSGGNSGLALWSAGLAALWSVDQLPTAAGRIQRALDATASLRGAWIDNVRASLRASVAALEGRREESLEGFAAALKVWTAMQLPFDHAMTVGDAVTVLGADTLPPGAVAEAAAFLEGIGAGPLRARLGTAVAADAKVLF